MNKGIRLVGMLFGAHFMISQATAADDSVLDELDGDFYLAASPSSLYINVPTVVLFEVGGLRPIEVKSLVLTLTDAFGNYRETLGSLNDQGEDGDFAPEDGVYTFKHEHTYSDYGVIYVQAFGITSQDQFFSTQRRSIPVTDELVYTEERIPPRIINLKGQTFRSGEIRVRFSGPPVNRTIVDELVALVGGTLAFFDPSINRAVIKVPVESVEELDALIKIIGEDPRTLSASRNFVPALQ